MTAAVAGRAPTATTRAPRIRHGFLAAALLAVAGLRAMSGDWMWAAVLGLGAVAELAVLLLARRRAVTGSATEVDRSRPARPGAETLRSSELAHRQAQRMWTALLGLTAVGGLALVLTAPSLAAVLGTLALVALARVRRERASVQRLRVLQGRRTEEVR